VLVGHSFSLCCFWRNKDVPLSAGYTQATVRNFKESIETDVNRNNSKR